MDQAQTRLPFVDLYYGNTRIPLIDTSGSGSNLLLRTLTHTIGTTTMEGNILQLEVIDKDWNWLDQRLAADILERGDGLGATGQFSISYGWRGVDRQVVLPRLYLFVQEWAISYIPMGGSVLNITFTDMSYALNMKGEFLAFDSRRLISDVIQEVLETHNIPCEVDTIWNCIGTEHNKMQGRTPMQYILDILKFSGSPSSPPFSLTRIPQADGRTKIKVAQWAPGTDIKRSYIVGRDREGQVLSYTPRFNGILAAFLGGNKFEAVWYDPVLKASRDVVSSHVDDLDPASKDVFPIADKPLRTWFPAFGTLSEVESAAVYRRSWADLFMYPADASIMGDPELLPYDMVRFIVLAGSVDNEAKNRDVVQVGSGIFQLIQVAHTITAGSFKTDLAMYRRGTYTGKDLGRRAVSINEPQASRGHGVDIPVRPYGA